MIGQTFHEVTEVVSVSLADCPLAVAVKDKVFDKPEIDYDKPMPYYRSLESIEAKQEVANKAAQDYNERYHPTERAVEKGYTDVAETSNGGVTFERSSALYICEDVQKGIVTIELSGNRPRDFDAANKKLGLLETPDGYVWHRVDDYDAKTNTATLQLVKVEAHNAAKPHAGACKQFDAVNGPSYNPSRKENVL